jgi:hypothetical protein
MKIKPEYRPKSLKMYEGDRIDAIFHEERD